MNQLHGQHLIGASLSSEGTQTFQAVNPATSAVLEPAFCEATSDEIARALKLADESFDALVSSPPEVRAALLDSIADGLVQAGDELLELCHTETALPMPRLIAERERTVGQSRLFAELLREGSWVEAKIDHGNQNRKPLPKPDVRSMLFGMGPVVVFGASNFPLAISVAGTDTTTAFAAGCPVVVKAHPAHPGTCERIGEVVRAAIKESGLPPGIFSLLHGRSHEVGRALVEHPATAAVAFTGSLAGGRALFDAASRRPRPIPVYAEMGSVNPVFVLPDAMAERTDAIAHGFIQSVSFCVGQLCTNPGLFFVLKGPDGDRLIEKIKQLAAETTPGAMLHSGIKTAFTEGIHSIANRQGVDCLTPATDWGHAENNQVGCTLFRTDYATFRRNNELRRELFGPCSTVVLCDDPAQMLQAASELEGQLTATLHATEQDLAEHPSLVHQLRKKAGRVVVNGFPTGVEVCHAIHHGGPYPAATDAHFTSIGPSAIKRFVRPVCYQDFPDSFLPQELQEANPRGILRLVDGVPTR